MRVLRRPLDGILLFDKPLGLSSNQALQQVRRLFQAEKAGHTGSLDPLATGMLPICFGEATKLCGLLLDSDKTYVARMRLGEKTTTGDAEGEVVERSDPAALTRDSFDAIKPRFLGFIQQVPPMYSALKQEGRRLYELAREGAEVERAPRSITIRALSFGPLEDGQIEFVVRCSKGTYVRSLAEDMAAELGQVAHLVALRRTAVDPFGEQPLWNLPALDSLSEGGHAALDRVLLPLSAAVQGWPCALFSEEELHRLSRGQAVRAPSLPAPSGDGPVAVMDEAGILKAIGRIEADGRVGCRRWVGGAVVVPPQS